jgi:hypothetical protein
MKYLITPKRNTFPPVEEVPAILQATKEYITSHLKDGTFDCVYIKLSPPEGVFVVNADSHAHVQEILLAHPQYLLHDWEVTPVLEWLPTIDRYIDYFQQQLG